MGVAPNDDGFFPVADEAGDAGNDNGLAEDSAAEDVTDCYKVMWLDRIDFRGACRYMWELVGGV